MIKWRCFDAFHRINCGPCFRIRMELAECKDTLMQFRGTFLPFSCFSQSQGKAGELGGQDPGFGVAVAIWLDGENCVRGLLPSGCLNGEALILGGQQTRVASTWQPRKFNVLADAFHVCRL